MAAACRASTAYSQDSAAMNSAGFTDYAAFVKAIYTQVQRARGSATDGFRFTTIWPMSRSATIWFVRPRMPKRTGKRFPTDRRISPARAASRATTGRIPTSAWRKRFMSCRLERPRRGRRQVASQAGSRLGLLQRRQPLDLRHLHVQSRQAVRDEVPALVALERGGGRPVLCPRLPRR